MHAVALDQRRAQAVGVFVQVFQGNGFGADITGTEHIGVVATDADDLIALGLDL